MNRPLSRALAVLGAAMTLPILVTTPASATPEDGKGCAGLPAIPQSYVCVISATPENAVPGTSTGSVGVPVPRVCYVADCVGPTTVNVPVPGVQPGTGAVAVLWYQGVYYPIAVGSVPSLALLQPYVTLVTGVAGTAVSTATGLAGTAVTIAFDLVGDAGVIAGQWVGFALDTAEPWVTFALDLVNDPPTTTELRDLVIENTIGYETFDAIRDFANDCRANVSGCLGIQSDGEA